MCSLVRVSTHLKFSDVQNHHCVVTGFVKTGTTICHADGLFALFCHRRVFILNCSASEIFFLGKYELQINVCGGPPEDSRISGWAFFNHGNPRHCRPLVAPLTCQWGYVTRCNPDFLLWCHGVMCILAVINPAGLWQPNFFASHDYDCNILSISISSIMCKQRENTVFYLKYWHAGSFLIMPSCIMLDRLNKGHYI